MDEKPAIHALIYGDPGAGKSTGAGTFPKPMLVFMFDPRGKETPYTKRGDVTVEVDDLGTPVQSVHSRKNGDLLIRVEHYIDAIPNQPEAYKRFLTRLTRLHDDLGIFRTVVLDSVTFMELAARKLQQYVLNPSSKEPRQWFAGSTDTLEEVLMLHFGALPCNVVVCAHIDEDKDEVHGTMVRNPAAPGRLRKRSPAGYSELYHAYVKRDGKGGREFLWQTSSDAIYNASSQAGAPDPCPQRYEAIWSGQ
jgi:hypothetical protein